MNEGREPCDCAQKQPACSHGNYLYDKWQAANELAYSPGLIKLRDKVRLAVLDEEQYWIDLWRTHYTPQEERRTQEALGRGNASHRPLSGV